jgi:hypothetical protein
LLYNNTSWPWPYALALCPGLGFNLCAKKARFQWAFLRGIYLAKAWLFKIICMKNSFRLICLAFLISLISMRAMAQTAVKANSSVGHISGYNNHVNNQNNWGLFGIIGVIALAGLTKRNVVQKN